ncbi:uncharacterized protein OCT59_015279 [Rhizophagus irregularis]|uniref:uncharacterized protein n=1 Tax=Rhizophagus irregularis TaxID=588596 RepID=UPI003320C765|nr:hypothetical protein OCT59_015279 [Rhizophagus irregularis]
MMKMVFDSGKVENPSSVICYLQQIMSDYKFYTDDINDPIYTVNFNRTWVNGYVVNLSLDCSKPYEGKLTYTRDKYDSTKISLRIGKVTHRICFRRTA